MELTSLQEGFFELTANVARSTRHIAGNIAQLSSGERITRAADDVAAMSVSTKLLSRTTALRSTLLNLSQADSMLQIASSAMAEQESILQRMSALSVMSNSGGLQTTERIFLDLELQSLKDELDRIANETNFAGVNLLNGDFDLAQAGIYAFSDVVDTGNEINGSALADNITGTDGNDSISALVGDDVVNAGAGNDTIDGGSGTNNINGGDGDDVIIQNILANSTVPTLPVSTGLVAHLDASEEGNITAAGSNFTSFDDLSMQNNDITGASGSVQTGVDTIGGLNSLTFDGASLLGIGDTTDINLSAQNQRSVMMSFRTGADVNVRQVLYEQGGGTNGFSIYIDGGQLYAAGWRGNGGTFNIHMPIGIQADTTYAAGFVFDFAGSGRFDAYLDGNNYASVPLVTGQAGHSGDIGIGGTRNATRFFDGNVGGNGQLFTGQIGEVLNYSSGLSSTQATQVQDYLVNKWTGSAASIGDFNGGAGSDTLQFTGASSNLELDGTSLTNIETIDFTGADAEHRLDITEEYFDAGFDAELLTINATGNTRGINVDASEAGDHVIAVFGSEVRDTITGGQETEVRVSYEQSGNAVNVDLFNGTARGYGDDILEDIHHITGSISHDTLAGSVGDDTMIGGTGDDLITDELTKEGRLITEGLVHYTDASNLASITGHPGAVAIIDDGSSNNTDARDDVGVTFSGQDDINDVNSLTFDGTNMLRINNTGLINTSGQNQRSIFTTFETGTDITSRQVIYEEGGGGNGYNIYIENGSIFVSAWRGNTFNLVLSTEIEANTAYTSGFVFDSNVDDVFRGYLNGEQIGELSNTVAQASHGGGIGIGGMNNASQFNGVDAGGDGFFFNGEIGEVLIYNNALKGDDLTDLNDFLANRRLNLGGNDSLSGDEGNDTLQGGRGNDTIDGGIGDDVALFDGNTSDFIIDYLGNGSVRVTDRRAANRDGSDLVHNVETLQFDNGTINVQTLIDQAGDISFQVKEASNQRLSIDVPNTTLARLFADTGFNITTQDNAELAFDAIQTALDILTLERAKVGAYQSSVDILIDVNSSALQNQTAARAVITDTDIARISTEFASNLVKNQLSISVATQTNELRASVILGLLDDSALVN